MDKYRATVSAQVHISRLQNILERYMKINPDSTLFSETHEWYRVESAAEKKPPTSGLTVSKLTFFSGAIMAASGLLLCYLLPYLSKLQQGESLGEESSASLTF